MVTIQLTQYSTMTLTCVDVGLLEPLQYVPSYNIAVFENQETFLLISTIIYIRLLNTLKTNLEGFDFQSRNR